MIQHSTAVRVGSGVALALVIGITSVFGVGSDVALAKKKNKHRNEPPVPIVQVCEYRKHAEGILTTLTINSSKLNNPSKFRLAIIDSATGAATCPPA